jgi:LPXTG-motif cell wall-anchored protein
MNKLSLLALSSILCISCSERVKEEYGSLIYVYIGLVVLALLAGIFFFKKKSNDTTTSSTSEQSSNSLSDMTPEPSMSGDLDNNSTSDPNQATKRGRGRPRKDSL